MSAPRKLVAITGMGCVSPIGMDEKSTRASLLAGSDGITQVEVFPVNAFQSRTAGQVPAGFAEAAVSLERKSSAWPRAAKLVLLAIHEARTAHPDFVPDVVIAGTTSGGMDFGEKFFRGLARGSSSSAARRFVRGYLSHQPVADVMEVLGWEAPIRVISNACASGTNALAWAAGLVRSGLARRVLAIGFDALAEMVFAGFDALRASTPEKCRPFDSERTGLALGEGAAAFFLEEPSAGGPEPLSSIAGFGFANDNHHLTQPDPAGTGPRLSMQRAIIDAGWSPDKIDYINAHGTGTIFNDATEAAAIRTVCANVPVSSTKGMTGHALGAAGAIEAAFCVHAIRGKFLPPNIHLRHSDSGLKLVANFSKSCSVLRVLSNSFGFGGANATVAIEGWGR